jgi:hypothetical protein
MEFYNTFRTQFELLPRVTIIYGKGQTGEKIEIIHNGLAIEWLWFGVFFNFGEILKDLFLKYKLNIFSTWLKKWKRY